MLFVVVSCCLCFLFLLFVVFCSLLFFVCRCLWFVFYWCLSFVVVVVVVVVVMVDGDSCFRYGCFVVLGGGGGCSSPTATLGLLVSWDRMSSALRANIARNHVLETWEKTVEEGVGVGRGDGSRGE